MCKQFYFNLDSEHKQRDHFRVMQTKIIDFASDKLAKSLSKIEKGDIKKALSKLNRKSKSSDYGESNAAESEKMLVVKKDTPPISPEILHEGESVNKQSEIFIEAINDDYYSTCEELEFSIDGIQLLQTMQCGIQTF